MYHSLKNNDTCSGAGIRAIGHVRSTQPYGRIAGGFLSFTIPVLLCLLACCTKDAVRRAAISPIQALHQMGRENSEVSYR